MADRGTTPSNRPPPLWPTFTRISATPVIAPTYVTLAIRNWPARDPWEAAAEESNVPQADTRAMDPDQCLSRRGLWISKVPQFDAVDPIERSCQCYPHG